MSGLFFYRWDDWKALQASKNLTTQYSIDTVEGFQLYRIRGYDGPDTHETEIWVDVVPDSIIESGAYDQATNDGWRADFETNFKNTANPSVVPKTKDGRVATLPNFFPFNTDVCITGAGDDPGAGIGKGTLFRSISADALATDHQVKWNFNDPVYLAGGMFQYGTGVVAGATVDSFDYCVHALATAVTSTPGTGNCDLVGNLIVPVAGGDSTVDLTAAIPVPNASNTGWFDWTMAANGTGNGTITENLAQTGGYDLYIVNKNIFHYLITVSLLGASAQNFTIPAVAPKFVLPQWEHVATIHNSGGAHTLAVVWTLVLARAKTVN